MGITGPLPEKLLRLMKPEDRKPMGKAGRTFDDVAAADAVKFEKELQKQIAAVLRLRDIEANVSRMDRRTTQVVGWPDFTFAYRGYPVAWEVKIPTGRFSKEQRELLPKLAANGWIVSRITSVRCALDFLTWLESMDPAHSNAGSALLRTIGGEE